MKLQTLFRRIIILDILFFTIFFFYYFFFQSGLVENFNAKVMDEYPIYLGLIILFVFILHFISLYLLYSFKKKGKFLYIFSLIIISTSFLSEPHAYDGIEIFLDYLTSLCDGAIIVLMYFTNLSRNFK